MLTKQYLDIWASASIFQNEKTIHWYSKTLQWDLKLAKALIQIKTNHAGGIVHDGTMKQMTKSQSASISETERPTLLVVQSQFQQMIPMQKA